MKKIEYINKYNKKNYKITCIAFKPDEKVKIDKILDKYKLSLRKYILLKINEERGD